MSEIMIKNYSLLPLLLLSAFCTVCSAAPQEMSNDANAIDSATSTTTQAPFKCSLTDPAMNEHCNVKAQLWKGTPKHDCCWAVLKNSCLKDNLEYACSANEEKFRQYFIKLSKDTEFTLSEEICNDKDGDSYCEPTLAEIRGEPIAGWMLSVAGVISFLLILCAIALGIKFC